MSRIFFVDFCAVVWIYTVRIRSPDDVFQLENMISHIKGFHNQVWRFVTNPIRTDIFLESYLSSDKSGGVEVIER